MRSVTCAVLSCAVLLAACASDPLGAGGDLAGPKDAGIDLATADSAGCPPVEVAATQQVKVLVGLAGAESRYVVTDGYFCDPFAIDRDGAPLPLGLGFQCGCECPQPGSPYVRGYGRLDPGGPLTITWDARELATCAQKRDCGMGFVVDEIAGALRPVAPRSYRVTVAYDTELPPSCFDNNGLITCQPPPPGTTPPAIRALCPTGKTASATFTLPPSGDVVVSVNLP